MPGVALPGLRQAAKPPKMVIASRACRTEITANAQGEELSRSLVRTLRAVIAALACAAMTANGSLLTAHHSFSAEFDALQPVSLDGAVSRVEWRNPHVWLYVDVADPGGLSVTWAIEASTPSALARRGLLPASVPLGVRVVVHGYRAKNGTPTARGLEITLPDRRTLSLGEAR
jgi:uncharacterized protein DUF6152